MFLDMRSAWNHDRGRRSQGGGRSGDLTAARARQPVGDRKGGAQPNAGIVPLRERRRRAHHGGANRTMEGNLRLLICAALAVMVAGCADDGPALARARQLCEAMYPVPAGATDVQAAQARAFAEDCYDTRARAIATQREIEYQRGVAAYGAMRAGGAFGPVPVRVVP